MVTASRSAIEEATPSKWKSEEERSSVTAPDAAAASEMASVVRAWQNPNFQHVTEVPAAVAAFKKSRLNCGAVRFKRSMFRGLSVIGQVDKKFIAATMPHDGDGSGRNSSRLFVLFDQHAVHERIRLETLIKGQLSCVILRRSHFCTKKCTQNEIIFSAEAYPSQAAVVSGKVDPPIKFSLPADERRLLFHYPSVPAKFGLCVTSSPSGGSDDVSATAVPGMISMVLQ